MRYFPVYHLSTRRGGVIGQPKSWAQIREELYLQGEIRRKRKARGGKKKSIIDLTLGITDSLKITPNQIGYSRGKGLWAPCRYRSKEV